MGSHKRSKIENGRRIILGLTNIVKKVTDEIGSLERYDHINNDVLKIVKELNVLAQDLLAESKNVEDVIEQAINDIDEAYSQANDVQYNAREAKEALEDLEL